MSRQKKSWTTSKIVEKDNDEEAGVYGFNRNLKIINETYLFINVPLQNTLDDNAIEFGLRNSKEGFDELKINENLSNDYLKESDDEYDYIYKTFSLTSFSQESLDELLDEFKTWLKGLPRGLDKKQILDRFNMGLK